MKGFIYLLFSFFLLSNSYGQEVNKVKCLTGYLDDDDIVDTLTYYKSNQVIKCDLLSSKIKLKF